MTTKTGKEKKRFNGETFELASVWTNKARAKQEATWYKKHKGYKARVTKDAPHSMSHAVWVKHPR